MTIVTVFFLPLRKELIELGQVQLKKRMLMCCSRVRGFKILEFEDLKSHNFALVLLKVNCSHIGSIFLEPWSLF